MPINPNELVNIEEAKLEAFDAWVTQNSRNELYFNPVAMSTFDKTTPLPTEAIGFKILSEKEIALFFVEPSDKAVPFKRSKNKRTGRCSFTSIVATRPHLKAPKGRQIRYPFRLDTPMNQPPQFVLIVGNVKKTYPTRSYTSQETRSKKAAKPQTTQAPSQMNDTPESDA